MDTSGMKIREVEAALFPADGTEASQDLVEACRLDSRQGVARLVRRYEREQAERARVAALYAYEDAAAEEGFELVAGVDEAGRGPLAGPVSVAAVILPRGLYLPKLNDSKKLSANVREELYDEIQEKAIAVSSVLVDAKTIDRVNIYQATMNGMYEAIFGLDPAPQKVLIDAVHLEKLPMPEESIIKGDAKSASIAAASIIAKVTRDRNTVSRSTRAMAQPSTSPRSENMDRARFTASRSSPSAPWSAGWTKRMKRMQKR